MLCRKKKIMALSCVPIAMLGMPFKNSQGKYPTVAG